MKRICLGLIGFLFFIYACNNDLKTIGQDMVANGNYIEEKEVPVTSIATVQLDSFVTSCGRYGSNIISELFVGRYKSEKQPAAGGVTTAVPCFQITPLGVPQVAMNAVLDSVTFHMKYAGKIWGDTIYNPRKQSFELYQLKEVPKMDYEKGGFFYNNTAVRLDSCIGSSSFYPNLTGINNTTIRIDDKLANDLFERIRFKRDDDIYRPTNSEFPYIRFMEYFKGLALVPGDDNDCLFSVNSKPDSLYMQFNYREGADVRYLRFPIGQVNLQYNQILTDKTGTPFEELQNQTMSLPMEKSGFSLAQGFTGYMVKMQLPVVPIRKLYTTIIKAQMEVKAKYIKKNPLTYPSQIIVYMSDKLNRINGLMMNSTDIPVTGYLEINETNPQNSKYVFDMTEYYQRRAGSMVQTEGDYVLLSVPTMNLTYDQLKVFEKPVVRFYYANYKQ